MSEYTPEQLIKLADAHDFAATKLAGSQKDNCLTEAARLRAHAAALERIERLTELADSMAAQLNYYNPDEVTGRNYRKWRGK